MKRSIGVALALVFFLAHAPFLPTTLEDIDSVNFALGLRDFDVAQHRPHPPGYPVYIALGKAAVFLTDKVTALGSRAALEGFSLGWLSLLFGTLAVPLLYHFFCCLKRSDDGGTTSPAQYLDLQAIAATALTVACPLYWYMAVRPMSDTVGLTAALAAQLCLGLAWWRQQPKPDGDRRLGADAMASSGRMIVMGALLAGFAIGFRTQTMWLTAPLLLGVLVDRIGRGVAGAMIGSTVWFTLGALAWAVPLVVVSGGLGPYLAALGSQAGEDFTSGEMLYQTPTPRVAAIAALRTLVYPWDSIPLAFVVLALAAIGAIAMLARERRAFVVIVLSSAPYLIFHMLFHDTFFVRYALPLVPVMAFLAVRGAAVLGARAAVGAAAVLSIWSVVCAAPVLSAYAAEASPAHRAVDAMRAEIEKNGQPGGLAMHQAFRRPLEAEDVPVTRIIPAPPRREWLELVHYWHDGYTGPLWFLADPARTELALIDPASRQDRTDFGWRFRSLSTFGGMRPYNARWYRLSPPGWFADEGWSLTPETAGIARLMGRGPHLGPITAWVRRRSDEARVMIGGRNLATREATLTSFTATVDGRQVLTWDAPPGFFLHLFDLPAGTLAGEGPLAQLTIESSPAAIGGPATAIEQFDLQSNGVAMWGFGEGWHEAEFDAARGPWRWTSDRAQLVIDGATSPMVLHMVVESPRRYFNGPVNVRISAGSTTLATQAVDDGSTEISVELPVAVLATGTLSIETDRTFVPAEQGGAADRRRLGLRVLSLDLVPTRAALR